MQKNIYSLRSFKNIIYRSYYGIISMNNPAKSFAFISPDKFARETLIKNCGRFAVWCPYRSLTNYNDRRLLVEGKMVEYDIDWPRNAGENAVALNVQVFD